LTGAGGTEKIGSSTRWARQRRANEIIAQKNRELEALSTISLAGAP
jgi:hypothetical protein